MYDDHRGIHRLVSGIAARVFNAKCKRAVTSNGRVHGVLYQSKAESEDRTEWIWTEGSHRLWTLRYLYARQMKP